MLLFSLLSQHINNFKKFKYCFINIIIINIFIDYAITVVPFPPSLHSILPTPSLPHSPYSSCPWVIHVKFFGFYIFILFFSSPCLFSTYHLCYLFSVPFPLSPPPTPPLVTLHVISISVIPFLF